MNHAAVSMESPYLEINAGNGRMQFPLEGQAVTIGRQPMVMITDFSNSYSVGIQRSSPSLENSWPKS